MRKIGWILIGWFSVLLIAGLILIFTAKTKNNPSGPGPGPGPGPECIPGLTTCPAGENCVDGKCITNACGGCPPKQFCNDGFCTQCDCKGLECSKVTLPYSECGGAATQCKVGKGDGCLKPFSPADSNEIKYIVPFICLKSDDGECFDKNSLTANLTDLNNRLGSYSELSQVFGIFTLKDGYIVSEINNISMNFDSDKIQAGFFKLCSDVTDIFNGQFDNIGVFVYDYDAGPNSKTGNMYLASYAYTYKDATSPTYIQGKRPTPQPGIANPKITGTFKFPLSVDLKNTTSIYYASGLYSSGGAPESICVADASHTNEPGVYLIGNQTTIRKLGLCATAPADKTCGEGNYFNQLIGKCICKSCVESDGCESSLAPRQQSQINNMGWWPAGKYCPPVCEWQPWSEWDALPSGCKPMYLACLGRGAQKRYRHLKNINWEYSSQEDTCKILGNDTTISWPPSPPAPPLPGPTPPPVLPPDTLGINLSDPKYIPYLGYYQEDGLYVANPDIYDTDTRPCGVSISVCGTDDQGGENLSSPGESCKKAGLYWNVAPFIPLGPGPSGVMSQPGPSCSMCHSGATSTGPDYDKNLENRKNVTEYNESGASSNLSKVERGSCWCEATWCHTNLDRGPGTEGKNPNGCFTVDPSGNMGKLGSSQSACWAYYACPGAGCEHRQQCASTTCEQGTCRVNEIGSGEVTWFKCGPNQLNVYCTADSDCPGSYCANNPPKKPPYQCFSGSTTKPGCVIVSNPNKSSPGAYNGKGVGGYYTIYGGPSGPGYDYGVYNSPTDDNQGTKKCNEYGMGAPWIPV